MNNPIQLRQQDYAKPAIATAHISVSQCADLALEGSSRTRIAAQSLLDDLHQREGDGSTSPCRSGIDGKLQDAADNSDVTLKLLQELRIYLLG